MVCSVIHPVQKVTSFDTIFTMGSSSKKVLLNYIEYITLVFAIYLTLVIHLRCSLILQLNALVVFFVLLLFDFENYYYLNCQCHCLHQAQVCPQCKGMFKFLCPNLNSALFSNAVFGRLDSGLIYLQII